MRKTSGFKRLNIGNQFLTQKVLFPYFSIGYILLGPALWD